MNITMIKKDIATFCKELGCCDTCCLRYTGLKTYKSYQDSKNAIEKYIVPPSNTDTIDSNKGENFVAQDKDTVENIQVSNNNGSVIMKDNSQESVKDDIMENSTDLNPESNNCKNDQNLLNVSPNENKNLNLESENESASNEIDSPPAKRYKLNICSSCLGILQEDTWMETFEMVREMLEKKGYECALYACALSSPISIILREKAITLRLRDKFPKFDESSIMSLKDCWRLTFAAKMASHINKSLDSGAVCPLLITLNYDYPDDLQELEILKLVSPKAFHVRSRLKRRYDTEFTRRSVDEALRYASLRAVMAAGGGLPIATAHAKCVSVYCNHKPMYIGGRYIKLSRNLSQSPWVLDGKRVLPSSVQEIIFKPVADFYKFTPAEAERRLKFVAAGREDVDVRCIGEGRPFAIEITDPRRQLTDAELAKACEEISKSKDVIVKSMVPISREDLTLLKKGEETKCKTYEALCIKLTHSKYDNVSPESPVTVTEDDIKRINEFRNTEEGDTWKVKITQKTPIRVLHRRPLLTRTRGIISLKAYDVPGHPQLFRLVLQTTAGTYVKEWVCGELGRTDPALDTPLRAKADLIALDVSAVHLEWPPDVNYFEY